MNKIQFIANRIKITIFCILCVLRTTIIRTNQKYRRGIQFHRQSKLTLKSRILKSSATIIKSKISYDSTVCTRFVIICRKQQACTGKSPRDVILLRKIKHLCSFCKSGNRHVHMTLQRYYPCFIYRSFVIHIFSHILSPGCSHNNSTILGIITRNILSVSRMS